MTDLLNAAQRKSLEIGLRMVEQHLLKPSTQRRAAYILGLRAEIWAVHPLIEVLGSPADVYVRAEAACALGKIGTATARAALQLAQANTQESFLVRRVAAQGMTNPQRQEEVN